MISSALPLLADEISTAIPLLADEISSALIRNFGREKFVSSASLKVWPSKILISTAFTSAVDLWQTKFGRRKFRLERVWYGRRNWTLADENYFVGHTVKSGSVS